MGMTVSTFSNSPREIQQQNSLGGTVGNNALRRKHVMKRRVQPVLARSVVATTDQQQVGQHRRTRPAVNTFEEDNTSEEEDESLRDQGDDASRSSSSSGLMYRDVDGALSQRSVSSMADDDDDDVYEEDNVFEDPMDTGSPQRWERPNFFRRSRRGGWSRQTRDQKKTESFPFVERNQLENPSFSEEEEVAARLARNRFFFQQGVGGLLFASAQQQKMEDQRKKAEQGLRRLEIRNAPLAFVELSPELVVLVLKCLPVGERHAVASNALCRSHVNRVRERRDIWLPLCSSEPWCIRPKATRHLSALELRKLHRRVLLSVDRARRGTVHDVARTMAEFADVAGVQRRCLERLVGLLHCERLRKEALNSRVTRTVVDALQNFKDDAALQAVALHCIVFLARPIGGAEGMVFSRGMASEGVDAFSRSAGVDAVLGAMQAHEKNPEVQAMGCWSLVNLALNRKQKLLLLRKSCLDRVLAAMTNHPSVLEVQFRALFALINLVIPEQHDDHKGRTYDFNDPCGLYGQDDNENVNGNVVEHVLNAMHTFKDSDKLIRCGCLVLHNLSLRDTNIPHLLAAGVAKPLQRAAKHHKDRDVQRSATLTLRRLGLPIIINNNINDVIIISNSSSQ